MLTWCVWVIRSLGLQEWNWANAALRFFGFLCLVLQFIGQCLHLPLVPFFASLFAFPLWFVLKQVSRLALFLLWRISPTQKGHLQSQAVFLVWCAFSLFLATAPEGWNSGFHAVAEMYWLVNMQDRTVSYSVSPRSQGNAHSTLI